MKLRVLSLPVGQLSKVVAVAMALVSVVFVVPMLLVTALTGGPKGEDPAVAVAMLLLMPFFYLVVGYLSTAFFVWVFNKVAAHLGGIDVEVAEPPPRSPPPEPPAAPIDDA